MFFATGFSIIITIWVLNFNRFIFTCMALMIFYYGLQLNFLNYFKSYSQDKISYAFWLYYLCLIGFSVVGFFITKKYTFTLPDKPIKASGRHVSFLLSLFAIVLFFSIIDVRQLFTFTRPGLVNFGYFLSMFLYVTIFLSYSHKHLILMSIQLVLLLFLSKLMVGSFVLYYLAVNLKISPKYYLLFLIALIFVFLSWGVFQDNLNSISDSNINRFVELNFFFTYVVEGGKSLVTQQEFETFPDFGVSALRSFILRIIPGFLLRELNISLVPRGITDSIVISGIESMMIHYNLLAPLFFTLYLAILLYLFNRSGLTTKFFAFSIMIFFVRSGLISALNNLAVLLIIYLLFFLLVRLLDCFGRNKISTLA